MKRKAHPRPLPPLSVEALHDVLQIEDEVRDALEDCSDPILGFTNPENARRIVRAYLVKAIDVQMGYYSSLPNYQVAWMGELVRSTVNSLIGVFPHFASNEQLRSDLLRTAAEHLVQKTKAGGWTNKPERIDRQKLKDEYLSSLSGEVKILDICWAADQHYREWKRWLNRELKDGSTADLAFRRVLTSGKRPEQIKITPRPAKWQ